MITRTTTILTILLFLFMGISTTFAQDNSYIKFIQQYDNTVDIAIDDELVESNVEADTQTDILALQSGSYEVTVYETDTTNALATLTLETESMTTTTILLHNADEELALTPFSVDAFLASSDPTVTAINLIPDSVIDNIIRQDTSNIWEGIEYNVITEPANVSTGRQLVGIIMTHNDESYSVPTFHEFEGNRGYNLIIVEDEDNEPSLIVSDITIPSELIYAGIPQSRLEDGGFVIGDPDALVTIVAFEDFLCPHCQRYEPTVKQFIADYVVTGQARFEYRFLPAVDPTYSALAGQLAECADILKPNSFWAAHDTLFDIASTERFNNSSPRTFAERMDIDYDELIECTEDAGQVSIDVALAQQLGITGTPTVMIRYGDAEPQTSRYGQQPTIEQLGALVEQASQ